MSHRLLLPALLIVACTDAGAVTLGPDAMDVAPGAEELLLDLDRASAGQALNQGLERARHAFRDGDVAGARDALTRLHATRPDLPSPALILARLHLEAGDLAGAHRQALEALADAPHDAAAHVTLGEIALRAGHADEASRHFERALTLIVDSPPGPSRARRIAARAHKGLASAAVSGGHWQVAREQLVALLALDPGNVSARLRLAEVLLAAGDEASALEQARIARSERRGLDPPEVLLARMAASHGDRDAAARLMADVEARHPRDPLAQRALARWRLAEGDTPAAERHARRAVELEPASVDSRLLLAIVAGLRGERATSEAILEALHREAPEHVLINDQLALLLAEHEDAGKRERALHLAQTNAELFPDSANALTTLGRVEQRLGHDRAAEDALRAALRIEPGKPSASFYLAEILARAGRADEARRLLHASLQAGSADRYRDDARALLEQLQERASD